MSRSQSIWQGESDEHRRQWKSMEDHEFKERYDEFRKKLTQKYDGYDRNPSTYPDFNYFDATFRNYHSHKGRSFQSYWEEVMDARFDEEKQNGKHKIKEEVKKFVRDQMENNNRSRSRAPVNKRKLDFEQETSNQERFKVETQSSPLVQQQTSHKDVIDLTKDTFEEHENEILDLVVRNMPSSHDEVSINLQKNSLETFLVLIPHYLVSEDWRGFKDVR
jgi:hypothetical protein